MTHYLTDEQQSVKILRATRNQNRQCLRCNNRCSVVVWCGCGGWYSGPGDQERRGEGGKLRPNYGDCSNPVLIVKVHHFLLTLGIFDLCSEDCEISNNLACNYSDES